MVATTSKYEHLTRDISKNIKIQTELAFRLFPVEYKAIVKEEKVDLMINKRFRYEGPGAAKYFGEQQDKNSAEIYEGRIETSTQKYYGLEFPISLHQRNFVVKNANYLQQVGEYNASSIQLIQEYECSNLFNLAFAGGVAGEDGEQYMSASHTWKSDGSTYSNLAASVALDKDAIQDIFVSMVQGKREQGVPVPLMPETIHIAWTNLFKLPELLKSVKDPDSANNTQNIILDYNLGMNLSHYFSSGTPYFVDTKQKTRTKYQSMAPTFDDYIDEKPEALVERSKIGFSTLVHDMLGTFGSAGA